MTSLQLTIHGAPRTKKNHGSVIQRGRRRFHIPSQPWTIWAQLGAFELGPVVKRMPAVLPIPRTTQLNCRALFYRDALAGDAVGYYQGLADLLQHAGVLEDDVSIVQWDGSRLLKDPKDPRVVLTLEFLTVIE